MTHYTPEVPEVPEYKAVALLAFLLLGLLSLLLLAAAVQDLPVGSDCHRECTELEGYLSEVHIRGQEVTCICLMEEIDPE